MADNREYEILIPAQEKWTPPASSRSEFFNIPMPHRTEIKSAANTPKQAFAALTGSLITVFASLGLLLAVKEKEVWPTGGIYTILQPAGIISLLLSLNAMFSGYALTEGVGVAWWRQTLKPDATLKTVQNVWLAGSSPMHAIKMVRRWTWVSIAVLLVTALPLNGVVLQSAVTTMPFVEHQNTMIMVPMAKTLDVGFSTSGNPGYDPDSVFKTAFPAIWQQVMNPSGTTFSRYAFFGSPETWKRNNGVRYEENSVYTANIPGVGFSQKCSRSSIDFDLVPTTAIPKKEGPIFTSIVGWDPSSPNDIMLEVLWKLGTPCSGSYDVVKCILSAAIVEYPVQIQMNVSGESGTPYKGPFFSLQRTQRGSIDETLETLPIAQDEGKNGSTYAGIAKSLGRTFNASVVTTDELTADGGVQIFGSFAEAMNLNYNYTGPNNFYCNLSLGMGLRNLAYAELLDSETVDEFVQTGYGDPRESANPADTIIGRLRQAMFLTSVYTGSQYYSSRWNISGHASHPESFYTQEVMAMRTWPVVRYAVRLDLWAMSVALTWATVFAILPTFWAYWRLPRKSDLTPVDIARAFDAPVVCAVDEALATEVLVDGWRGGKKIREYKKSFVSTRQSPESVQEGFGRWSGSGSAASDVVFEELVSPYRGRRFGSLASRY